MKKRLLPNLILCAILLFTATATFAQQCPYINNPWGSVTPGCNGFGTALVLPSTSYGTFTSITGVSYTVSTCGTGWDSQITGFDGSNNFIAAGRTSGGTPGGTGFENDDNGGTCAGLQASLDWTATYPGIVKVLVEEYSCGSNWTGTSAVLQIRQNTTVSNTTSLSNMCGDGSTKALTVSYGGTVSGLPTVAWSIVSGPGSITGTTYTASGVVGTSQIVTIRVTLGVCSSDVSFIVYGVPTTANAGADQAQCENGSFTITGNTPAIGTGSWSLGGGSANITSPGTATTGVTGVAAGTNAIITWTISNANCTSSTDNITLANNLAPTVNAAGPDAACQSATPGLITLSGATLGGSATTGAWSILSGGGSLSNTAPTGTPATRTYRPAANFSGTATLQLITDDPDGAGPCVAVTSTRTIVVNPQATVVAGGPDVVCQSATPSAITLSGSSVGGAGTTAAWSIVSGGGTLSSTAQTATPATVTYTPAANYTGAVVLQLLSDDPDGAGPCSGASANRTITVSPEAVSNAGGPDVACQSATPGTITLNGSSVSGSATTGAWSILSGGGTLSNTSQTATPATVTYTPAVSFSGTVTLQLLTNDPDGAGPCTAVTSTRTITVGPQPTVDAGGPDVVCESATPAAITLSGATFGGSATTGTWSILVGGGTLSSTSPTANPELETYTPAANFNGTVTLELVTDAPSSCIAATDTRTITVRPIPSVAPSNNSPLCAGDQINLNANASGGLPAYSYNWSGPLSYSSVSGSPSLANATAAMSGAYDVTVTDQNTCSASGTTSVVVNPLPNGNIGSSITVCSGISDTVLTFNFAVGTAPFDIIYTDGSSSFVRTGVNNGDTAHVAVAGTISYSFTQIQDANGCIRNSGFLGGATITVVSTPVITTINVDDVLCNGGNTGVITITGVASGTAPYTYSIDSGATFNGNTFNSLPVGTYNLVVADVFNCSSVYASNPVTISEPPVLDHTYVAVDASCANVLNGSITITPTGGVTPYSYSLDGGPLQPGNAFNSIAAGTYIVQVTDDNGCTDTSQVLIDTIYAITGSIVSQTDVSCFGGIDGSVTLSLTGGVTPYSYSINGIIFQASPIFTGLSSGNYVATLRDVNGCSEYLPVTIAQPNILQVLIDSVQNILCNGGSGGAIYITVTGGNGGNSFLWSNGDTNEDVTGLNAGNYNVAITDSKGCSAAVGATISAPLPLFLSVASYQDLLCNNDSSGEIDITVNGGVPQYSFAWSNGATNEDILNLPTNTYSVTVTDANGCVDSLTQFVDEPLLLQVALVPTNALCAGGADGSIDLIVQDGTPGYSFLWSNGQTTEDVANLTPGTYSVVAYDANGCSAVGSTLVDAPTAMIVTTIVTNVLCHDSLTGAIDLSVTDGAGGYTYEWSNGDLNEDLFNLGVGTYVVTVMDANVCTVSASVTITQPTAMVLNGTATSGCTTGSIDITVQGGVFPYSYLWSNGANTEDLNGLLSGTYDVTVSDVNGCTLTQSFAITAGAAPVTSFVTGTDVTCNGLNNGVADLTVTGGGTAPYTYLWSNFQNSEDISSLTAGTYYVIIKDALGCESRDSVIINEPTVIVLSLAVTNTSCSSPTASIDLTVTGGAGVYTFLWSNGDVTEDITGLGSGTYTVTVTDSTGCSATADATVSGTLPLFLNIASYQDVLCYSDSSGAIDITANGGVPPFTFVWSNGAISEDISSLITGTYNVTVTDANSCSGSLTQFIDEPLLLQATLIPTSALCAGSADGSIDLIPEDGTPGYTYLWSNGQTTEDVANLTEGTYSVVVYDANGCSAVGSTLVDAPTAMIVTSIVTNVSCFDSLTGAIDLSVTDGAGSYTYEWSNGDLNEDLFNIGAGTYSVTVMDANVCTVSVSVSVTQPVAMLVTANQVDVQCAGNTDGSISLNVFGGIPLYTFLWSDGSTNPNIQNLGAGTVSVTVTDANGCSTSTSFTISTPSGGITSTVTGTSNLCNGANTASATVNASGGTAPYTYFWSNFQGTATISGIGGGTYYVIITDANGCTHRDSIIIDEPTQLILTTTSTNISCFNANDGAIDLTVTGGTPTYSFLWSSGDTNEDLTALAGGVYGVTVTDLNSCTASTSVTIINPSAITTNFVAQNPLCYQDLNGSIDLIPSGGTPNYSFLWSNSAGTEDVSGIGAGVYTVTVSDANSCIALDTIIITEPGSFYLSGVIKHVSCFGYNDGAIDATAYGGTLPYSFTWSTGESTEDLWNLGGASDTVYAFDANGCPAVSIYVVNEPQPLTVSLVTTNGTCFGTQDGSVAVVPVGGVTPYRYLWDDFVTDSLRSNMVTGTYRVMLTDSNGCFTFDTATITQPAEINIKGVVTDATCNGSNNGAIDITVTGGTPGYTFVWTGGAVTEDLISITAGIYSITVTDTNSCVKIDSFEVKESPGLFTSVSLSSPICNGGNTGSILVSATGGVTPYTYTWSTTQPHAAFANNLYAGNYSVTVADANNCSSSVAVTLSDPDPIVVTTNLQGATCYNTTAAVTATVTGGTAPYNYLMNGVASDSAFFTALPAGDYVLLAIDVNGCQGAVSLNITAPDPIFVDLSATQQTILTGMETQLVATTDPGVVIIHYEWSPDTVFGLNSCVDCADPFVAPLTTTIFTVTVMNSDSCYASDTLTIYVNNEASKFIPTAFTPNGDGLNDYFEFDVLGAKKLEVSIFNRWGERIYYNPDQPNGTRSGSGWDGMRNGKPAPFDTYVYRITVTYWNDVAKDIAGTVTLMK